MSGNSFESVGRIVGLGLDQQDGHIRLTRGEGFEVLLGSEDSHLAMQQLCLDIERKLKERGLQLGRVSREVFEEILQELASEHPADTEPPRSGSGA